VLTVGTDHQFRKFCAAVDRPDLVNNPSFLTNGDRINHRRELSAHVRAILAERRTEDWLSVFGEVGVPCGPIYTLDQVYRHPQVLARDMVFQMRHPMAGDVPLTANPIHFREAPIRYELPPPTLGQHTQEVLTELLGMSPSDVERLAVEKAI
jgi:crotonobetainyl-CoA:carnitine CoA-transferase CaiB-like acyl-CoA transferase